MKSKFHPLYYSRQHRKNNNNKTFKNQQNFVGQTYIPQDASQIGQQTEENAMKSKFHPLYYSSQHRKQ
jgi:hypothetical protein